MTVAGHGKIDADRLRVRSVEPADYAGVRATMSSPKALAGTLQLPYTSDEHWRRRLAEPKPDSFMLVAEVRLDGEGSSAWDLVGSAGLHSTSPSQRRQHVAALGMAVRDDWQGRGVGSALIRALIDRADNWMNVLRIELTVFVDNDAARRLYEAHGFVVEGTHRAYALRDGAFVDALSMARLHPRPPTLPDATA